MVSQLYRPDRDVIDAVDGAEWMVNDRQWQYVEDVITATEKALDDALWDGAMDLAEKYKRELEGLRISLSVGEKYVTNW